VARRGPEIRPWADSLSARISVLMTAGGLGSEIMFVPSTGASPLVVVITVPGMEVRVSIATA